MDDAMLEVLRDIRELLLLIAEPQLEHRDKKRRDQLRKIIGRGEKKIAAALLMDGTRTRAEIARESTIDAGDLTKLVKALNAAKLLSSDGKSNPALVIRVSSLTFFEEAPNNG